MFKTLMASIILLGAAALPLQAQRQEQGPGCGPYDNCGGQAHYGQICTNDRRGRLNVRTGPGTNYRFWTQLSNGQTVTIYNSTIGHDGGGYRWQRIYINGREGWVRSDYVCD
ncbi:SH3 domain-containing protein [Crocosphaera sp.]|uniref:SH3 domain-containing protein n=1 Tax=Crocosphaera sp. TaxID=2729996 RepID=UPI003F1F1BA6|nr:SH3 domain-containing protein [Crocosphaera sp.]